MVRDALEQIEQMEALMNEIPVDGNSSPAKEELKIEYASISSVFEDPSNPRTISDDEFAALVRSLKRFGFTQPILVRKENRVIIAGNQRVRAARKLGMRTIPTVVIQRNLADSQMMKVALNRISGKFDDDLLGQLLADLEADNPGIDLSLTGFDSNEVHDLLESLEISEKKERLETFDVVSAVSQVVVISRAGTAWQLGDHLLVCGDSAQETTYERLLGESKARLLVTDPPYNVSYDRPSASRNTSREPITNDNLDSEAWARFYNSWSGLTIERTQGAMYIFSSAKEWHSVASSLEMQGAHWSTTIIWVKNHFTLGRSDYQRGFEPIWFGWPEGAPHFWCGDRDQSDVWHLDRPSTSPLHPTMKPVQLLERAIQNSSQIGDIVLDPFSGSGSTLIACERTGRKFRGIEIDPAYVDVAVARWESFTGQKAEKIEA